MDEEIAVWEGGVNVCGGMMWKNIGISSTCVLVGCMLLCGCVGLGKEDIYNEV